MRTTKPISTISYNHEEYLTLKLEEYRKAGRISFWAFVKHKGEDDEGGSKDHIHVYIEPAKMLQSDDLRNGLAEFDPTNPKKPLGCLKFNSSKFDDWYLYGLHDKRYLASKGQSRKYHYEHDNMQASDSDDLLMMSRSIDLLSLSPYADMEDAINHGVTFGQYFSRGRIPIMQLKQFQTAWELLLSVKTYRNGRKGHEPIQAIVDPSTGELIKTVAEGQAEQEDTDPEQ